jgi:hypothetical protein
MRSEVFQRLRSLPLANPYRPGKHEEAARALRVLFVKGLALEDYLEIIEKRPFHFIEKVSIEISNACNLACDHTRCPLNVELMAHGGSMKAYYKAQTILPDELIASNIIGPLAEHDYRGVITFHRYNEPTIDFERLCKLVGHARRQLPRSDIVVYTNGLLLNEARIRELIGLGATIFVVTAYSPELWDKYHALFDAVLGELPEESRRRMRVKIVRGVEGNEFLDDRMDIYDLASQGKYRSPSGLCTAPFREVEVACTGDVVICCYDWKNTIAFGNTKQKRLDEVLRDRERAMVAYQLLHGLRANQLCKACGKRK